MLLSDAESDDMDEVADEDAFQVAFWNTHRLGSSSGAGKVAAASNLRAAAASEAVVLCESVAQIPGMTLAPLIIGTTHDYKLKYQYQDDDGNVWHEVDAVREVRGDNEFLEYQKKIPFALKKVEDVANRRPLIREKSGVGIAALHAPAGGPHNTNLATLMATMLWLKKNYNDKWVLLGDLNVDLLGPDSEPLEDAMDDGEDGAPMDTSAGSDLLEHWLFFWFNHFTHQELCLHTDGVPTYRYVRNNEAHLSVLDYAISPLSFADSVTTRCLRNTPTATPYWDLSDHRPIVVRLDL